MTGVQTCALPICFPVTIVRFPVTIAKLKRTTNNLTISLQVTDLDACGSFQFHRVYGREDAAAPFVLLKQVSILNVSLISITVPNNKRWEIFVSSHFACNGMDSFNSNRVLVDDVAPLLFEPDSVNEGF